MEARCDLNERDLIDWYRQNKCGDPGCERVRLEMCHAVLFGGPTHRAVADRLLAASAPSLDLTMFDSVIVRLQREFGIQPEYKQHMMDRLIGDLKLIRGAAFASSRPLEEIEQACREMEVIAKSKRDIARLTDEPDYEANGMFVVIAHVRETLERLRLLVPGGDPQEP